MEIEIRVDGGEAKFRVKVGIAGRVKVGVEVRVMVG